MPEWRLEERCSGFSLGAQDLNDELWGATGGAIFLEGSPAGQVQKGRDGDPRTIFRLTARILKRVRRESSRDYLLMPQQLRGEEVSSTPLWHGSGNQFQQWQSVRNQNL